jgi:hemolysin activation/secretion protein
VDIPEQTVDEGVVRLKVTEGTIERVHVKGERYFSGRQIRAALPALAVGEAPHFPSLQEQLAALNARTPDRAITPVMKAGSQPGTVDVDLNVKDSLPLHATLEVNNAYTVDTTPLRASGTVSYDNLWQRQDTIALQYLTAPEDTSEATVWSVSYGAHLGPGIIGANFIHNASDVQALGTLGVLGKGSIFGLHWLQPLGGSTAWVQSWTIGGDYKDVDTEVFPDAAASANPGPGSNPSQPVTAPVTYINWNVGYTAARNTAHDAFFGTIGLNFGIRGLVNQPQEFADARFGGVPNYIYVRLSAQELRSLGAGFAVLLRLNGQWSADPLVTNEQFALGGFDSVRGYYEAEAIGDNGLAGTFELHTPALGAHFGRLLAPLYAFGFVDAGLTNLIDPLPGQVSNFHFWSTGLGLRLERPSGFSAAFAWAIPETNGVRTVRHASRVLFYVRYGF